MGVLSAFFTTHLIQTAAQYRRGKRLHKLPGNFAVDGKKLPIAVGKVTLPPLGVRLGYYQHLGTAVEEGRLIGREYGAEAMDIGLSPADTLRVYLFFNEVLLAAIEAYKMAQKPLLG